jgi:Fe/S biogenesis protein NfuA
VPTDAAVSPLVPPDSVASAGSLPEAERVITVSPEAIRRLTSLRDEEDDAAVLGVRLEIIGREPEFSYDMAFDTVTKAAMSDIVERHRLPDDPSVEIKVIIAARDEEDLRGAVLDIDGMGLALRNPNKPTPPALDHLVRGDALAAAVDAVIEGEVNPALAAHGGFVTLLGHDGEGVVYLTMGGGCHGCSMSRMTMLNGVQEMLKAELPEVLRVVDATDHASGENPYYS